MPKTAFLTSRLSDKSANVIAARAASGPGGAPASAPASSGATAGKVGSFKPFQDQGVAVGKAASTQASGQVSWPASAICLET